MLELRNIVKRFGQTEAVKGISLSVPDGAFLALLGPSGCGKTTLLRMLAGLEMPRPADRVRRPGRLGRRPRLGGGSGEAEVGAGVPVLCAVAAHDGGGQRGLAAEGGRHAPRDRRARVDEVLRMLSIDALAGRYPNEISGGQQQRVAIARTIAPKPGILLFDEPLSNLDAKLRIEMRTELMRLHRATGATTVYVTHDQIESDDHGQPYRGDGPGPGGTVRHPCRSGGQPRLGLCRDLRRHAAEQPCPGGEERQRLQGGRAAHGDHPPRDEALAMFRAESLGLADAEGPRTLPLELAEVSAIAGGSWLPALPPTSA